MYGWKNSGYIFGVFVSDKPVTPKRKEAWTHPITTIVVSPPEEQLKSGEPTKKFSFETWLDGPDIDSDEFDTDLEDDFPKGNFMMIQTIHETSVYTAYVKFEQI